MTKLSCLLFFCLFAGARLFAQADSSKPPSPLPSTVEKTQDTTPAPAVVKPAAHHRDSTHSSRHDSTHVTRQPKKDTITGVVTTVTPTAGIAVADSVRSASVPVKKGPDETVIRAIAIWKAALAANPSFNFPGRPVVESSEIHRPNSKDSLFYLMLGILFYFALVRIFFEKYFGNLITLFFRVSLRQQQIREQVQQTPLPSC